MSDSVHQQARSNGKKGSPPPDICDLLRVEDRISFLYFEHCKINRDDNAIAVHDTEGTICIPSATLSVLMLGPGSTVTHDALMLMGECGVSVVWVGERGIRMYASGRPLTHSSALLQAQARLVSNRRSRLDVARKMYGMRFPGEDVSTLTMQQLRGREGVRIRKVYKHFSEETGVEWDCRKYNPNDFDDTNEINKALTAAHACLYGIAYSVINALGCSSGLGFVHTGHERSFVYDIADLYKAGLSIPVAFKTTAQKPADIGAATRRNMRDAVYDLSILPTMVKDIKTLLSLGFEAKDADVEDTAVDHVGLWDEKCGEVASGKSYVSQFESSGE